MVKKANILTLIKTRLPAMTESEKAIAQYIVGHPEEIFNLKIENLSKKLKVSLPTVFRFAKNMGFKGFKDFKVALIRDLALAMNIASDDIKDGSIEAVTKNIFMKFSSNLQETQSLIDYDDIKKAVEMILSAKRIIFFGVSYSASTALDAYTKFLSAGFNCIYNTDAYAQRIISTQCSHKDLAIGISFSGASLEIVDCMKNAKANKAKTISVTSFFKAPVTRYSDICLYSAPVYSQYQKFDLPSKISFAAILDSLYLNSVLKRREKNPCFLKPDRRRA